MNRHKAIPNGVKYTKKLLKNILFYKDSQKELHFGDSI